MAYPAGVLWDMDGTLVNTEPIWRLVEEELVSDLGGTFTLDSLEEMVGLSLPLGAQFMRDRMGLNASVDEIVSELDQRMRRELLTREVQWCAGALEAISFFHGAGIPMALVTSSPWAMTSAVVEKLPEGTFSGVVTGDQVGNAKPHPEPYLRGAELTSSPIEQTLIFEDSLVGLQAAVDAGGLAVAVPNQIPIPASPKYSRLSSLLALEPDVVERLGEGEILDLL